MGQAGYVAALIAVPVVPGLRPLIASFITPLVAPFSAPPFVPGADAAHGKAKQGDGCGEKNKTGFHVGLLGGSAVNGRFDRTGPAGSWAAIGWHRNQGMIRANR